ncbi:MAG: glycyl-radical enzyme activating protein [Desulfosarcina sp.]|nr:glycyl-radical enzyme activating protein [Desulfobacterales bacterium]
MKKDVLITKVQRFSLNDGPGFRTNVYIKGCSLKCRWCHNPETQSASRELYWKKMLCVQCGACLDACPSSAINPPVHPAEARKEGSSYYKIIHERCDGCMKCVEACPYGALETVGEPLSVAEVLAEVESDRIFYENSNGGMTISGGEPLTQCEFVAELMDEATKAGISICLDTSGNGPWKSLKPLASKADIVLYDLKHIDSAEHKKMTGVPNEIILQNLINLSESGSEIWLRVLLIPDYTDSFGYHRKVVEFLKGLPRPISRIDLLPYHNWCEDKYAWLGKLWPMDGYEALVNSDVEPLLNFYTEAGLNATIGGSGFEHPQQTHLGHQTIGTLSAGMNLN